MLQMDLIPGLPNDIGLECLIRVPMKYFFSIALVCRSWNRVIELPKFWRLRRDYIIRNLIVMTRAVGPNKYANPAYWLKEVFDPKTAYRLILFDPYMSVWGELPPILEYSDGLPMFCQLVAVGLNLVVMGGLSPMTYEVSNDVFIYDFVIDAWRLGASMPGCQRSCFACASDSDRMVFVAGGYDGEKCALKSAMAYDVEEDKWEALPDMTREHNKSKGVYGDGKFHVIGGYCTSRQSGFETSAESFDVVTWRWGSVQEDFLNSTMIARQREVFIIKPKLYYAPYKDFPLDFKSSNWDKVLRKKRASQALFNSDGVGIVR